MDKKSLTIGIPAFKAESTIIDCIASIQIQSLAREVEIIIAKDNPEDNYDFVKTSFPNLDITILECEKNTGPGLARQRALEAATTQWITFMDADDVLISPYSLAYLGAGITENCIEVQGTFCQENDTLSPFPMKNPHHPWVFGRLYNINFLKGYGIEFSELRAMEDGEFNWKISMSIEGTPFTINVIDNPVYLWRTGSEHSITRIGVDENGIPQYNFDLCQWGATVAAINAIKFCKKKNPFNGSITRFTVEQMIGTYFTYIECLSKKPIFAEQNLFNAKRFYNECYKEIENTITEEILNSMYTIQRAIKGEDLLNIIPQITFFEFMDLIKSSEYKGEEEFKEIRNKLPQDIIDNDIKTGVSVY